jgi:hypothetical protein
VVVCYYGQGITLEGANPPNENIRFYNNIWSDPTGSMGAEEPSRPHDFSDTPPGQTTTWTLARNLYWNGGAAIPVDDGELINFTADASGLAADPLLPDQAGVVLPRWDENTGLFADGSATIREAFVRLANRYGLPAASSPVVDAGNTDQAPIDDLLGNVRPAGLAPDIGAVEFAGNTAPTVTPSLTPTLTETPATSTPIPTAPPAGTAEPLFLPLIRTR